MNFHMYFLILCLFCSPLHALIYIYNDKGVWPDDVGFITEAVQSSCPWQNIRIVNAADIKEGFLNSSVDCFIGPGGADAPFHTSLGEEGMNIIRCYVSNGGRYLGLCASGYFGSRFTAFYQNPPAPIIEEKELGLAGSIAMGPVYPYDGTKNSARVINLMVNNQSLPVYYNGGGQFISFQNCKDKPIAYYIGLEEDQRAIIYSEYGNGKVVLTGVHPELSYAQCLLHLSLNGQKEYEEELKALGHLEETRGKYYLFKMLLAKLGLEVSARQEDRQELSLCERITNAMSCVF